MLAHAADLRSEVKGEGGAGMAKALLDDWRTASLSDADRALCAFAEALTLKPGETREGDLVPLRDAGFDDRAIHDAVQAIAYFAYINRVADGLGVDLEPDMAPPRRPGAPPGDTEMPEPFAETESMSMTIVWRCLKCNTHFPAGEPIPDACTSCGAPRTEFELVEED